MRTCVMKNVSAPCSSSVGGGDLTGGAGDLRGGNDFCGASTLFDGRATWLISASIAISSFTETLGIFGTLLVTCDTREAMNREPSMNNYITHYDTIYININHNGCTFLSSMLATSMCGFSIGLGFNL